MADAISRGRGGMRAGSGSSIAGLGRYSASLHQARASSMRNSMTRRAASGSCDGRLIVLTMFKKRLLAYSNGELSLYADLSDIATGTIDDMIVDGLGRAYVGDLGFDLPPPPDRGAAAASFW